MPIIETVEQLAEFLEQNDEWRRVDHEMRERFERVDGELARPDIPSPGNTDDIAELKRMLLEKKYRNQACSYFSRLLKNPRVVHFPEIEERLAPIPPPTEQERDDLIETDLFVVGTDRSTAESCWVDGWNWIRACSEPPDACF